jgi:predicted CXXCH cytochrome family protein
VPAGAEREGGAMRRLFENKEHLLRMAALFVAALGIFLVIQTLLVPKGFGEYGHYRSGALADNQARPLAHAGHAACRQCHGAEADALKAGKHASVACEACHGPLGRHSEDSKANKAVRPDGRTLCLRCHVANVAKPGTFPQVDVADHSPEGSCIDCHVAHSPKVS